MQPIQVRDRFVLSYCVSSIGSFSGPGTGRGKVLVLSVVRPRGRGTSSRPRKVVQCLNNSRNPTSGWTPYFPLLSGVVTELGGFLSHGAVVAREFGLPAVVGVVGATSYIKQGDRIAVDGANGTVTKLD